MNILRQYLLSNVCRSPDEGGAPEPQAAEAAVEEVAPAAEEVAEPVAEEEEPVVVEPEPAAPPNTRAPKWAMERISEETNKRQQEADRATAAERRAADAEAMLQRLQAGKEGSGTPVPAARTETQPQDFNSAVKAEANLQRFYEDTTEVLNSGVRDFPNFQETRQILGAVGALQNDFVMDVLAVDKANAHKILDQLAKDPEKAAALVGMDSRRRTAELTRLSMAAAAPVADAKTPAAPARTVSRAPTPKPAIAPHASAAEVDPMTPEGNEKMSDAAFEKWYKAKYMKRA